MKYYANSVFEYIRDKVDLIPDISNENKKLLFMIPVLPSVAAINVCRLVEGLCLELGSRVTSTIKIAHGLCNEWRDSEFDFDKNAFREAKEHGWYDETGNLTRYRNAQANIVLLIGTDRVTDSSSLSDFHRCDVGAIWDEWLQSSFAQWIEKRLEEASVGYEESTVAHFDQILKPLMNSGLADILQISQLLEELDLTGCQDGRDSEKALLDGLKHFKLPSFIGYRFLRNKKFEVYLEDAIEFFSYDMFKEDRARKKGLETIAKFIKENEDKIINNECFDEIVRIPYNTDGEFIEGLREYIEEEASECREKLLNCDFVTVRDHILKFKKKGSTPSKKIKKLSGGPIEVLLHAVWLTLGEFKAAAANLGEFAHEAIEKIVIEPTLYKHDYEAEIGSEVESVEDRNQRAISYLMRLIGGVDTYLTQHVNLSAACGDNHQAALECRLENQEVRCQYARTAEPCLEFSVTISGVGWDEPVSRKFAWRLPEIHPYRLADELILWAVKEKRGCRDAWHLPVFHVPYYDELMLARDDEEIRRVLSQCIKDKGGNAFNLLSATGAERGGALLKHLQALAGAYDQFLVKAKEDGLHASLLYNWNSLRQAYEKALGSYIHDKECENNPLAPMLLRAFLIIKRCHAAEGDSWVWRPYEQSGVVTVLHPALLEMLEAHILYLFACFNSALVTELRAPAQNAFKESTWQSYTDLAEIQMPLTGLICDRNKILDTNVRGEGLIHRIGNIDESEATLTTRLLLKYEAFEDDEITDADIFRETRESKLLYRMMHDYRKMHPHAEDGLSIAVSRNKDIQPVIAAVHSYLTDLWEQGRQDREFYAMSVTIFTESSDDSSVSRWIEQWKERWEYAENDGKLAHYRKSRLSVSHRIISSERYYQQFIALIKEGLEVDIVFLYDFIGAGMDGNDFKKVSAYDATSHTLKFPILEKPFCSSNEPGRQLQRARILSNRQFRLSTLHAEIMARFKHPTTPQSLEHVVLGFGDYTPWQGVIDAFHNRAEWIVCIDPNIDERLIEKRGQETGITREIIGFGSGVGSHGEANYTVSTEQFALADVHHRLKASIAEIYPQWQSLGCEQVAKSVLEETRKLSGLSLVRATGIGDEHIREFMAYSLARKLFRAGSSVLCDQLISIDAYRHWFETSSSDIRPDLLWLIATIGDTGRLHLCASLLECKMAKKSDEHIGKARQQIQNGLRHLVSCFMPRTQPVTNDDDRPDQRYWWLQLHRLIASKAEISSNEQERVLTALEYLAAGDFSITWNAAVLTFWSDIKSRELSFTEELLDVEGKSLPMGFLSAGSDFILDLCQGEAHTKITWPSAGITFISQISKKPVPAGTDNLVKDEDKTPAEDAEKDKISIIPDSLSRDASRVTKPAGAVIEKTDTPPKISRRIPDRILLGTTVNGNRRVFWEFGHNDLNNRHMLIFGSSGMGKTYTIQCLLCELGRHNQNSLIIDYTNGFSEQHLEPVFNDMLNPAQHIIRTEPLPVNPFRRLDDIIGKNRMPESTVNTAQRVAGVFSEVYNLGEQQKAALYTAVKNGLERCSNGAMSLSDLIDELKLIEHNGGTEGRSAGTITSKILPFVDMNPFGQEQNDGWDRFFHDTDHRCHILQLIGFMKDAWRLIVEFSLIDLYAFYRASGSKDRPRVVVLDEVQNLDQREDSPLSQLLREGRKFGFSLILATQIMSDLHKDERDRLFNAGHKLFFRPADTEMRSYADIAAITTGEDINEWVRRLSRLQKGECYSIGPSLNDATGNLEVKALKIKVTSMNERGFND